MVFLTALPYALAVYFASAAARSAPPSPRWDKVVSTLAISLTIVGVAARVQRASVEGTSPSPWLHAALLAAMAFALPCLFLKRVLARACVGCPNSGRVSMAILAVIAALATEQVLLWLLGF